jgi:hypothetical protein
MQVPLEGSLLSRLCISLSSLAVHGSSCHAPSPLSAQQSSSSRLATNITLHHLATPALARLLLNVDPGPLHLNLGPAYPTVLPCTVWWSALTSFFVSFFSSSSMPFLFVHLPFLFFFHRKLLEWIIGLTSSTELNISGSSGYAVPKDHINSK